MTHEKEQKEARQRADALIDELLAEHGISPEAILGQNGLMVRLTKRVVEKALSGELTHHLGYAKGAEPLEENCRNGSSAKTVITEDGPVENAVPRDRAGSFEPRLIAKGHRRFEGFDEKIIVMYGFFAGCETRVGVASFLGLLLAQNLWTLLGAQILFGLAVGLIYYSSLYYSMHGGNAKTEHGGLHEAMIGLGTFIGAGAGVGAKYFFPDVAGISIWAVGGVLAAGFCGLIWLRYRKENR